VTIARAFATLRLKPPSGRQSSFVNRGPVVFGRLAAA
jgi:hypothetical protein